MAFSIYDRISTQYLKDTFLLGVDLTLDDGTDYPEYMFEEAIKQAVSMLELDLGVVIEPRRIKEERHDADIQDKNAHHPIHLDYFPLLTVDELAIKIGTTDAATLPLEWVTINNHLSGKFNIIPTATTVGSLFFRSGVPILVGDVFSPYSKFPSYFAISYTAGFLFDSSTFTIPAGQTKVEVPLADVYKDSRPRIDLSSELPRVVMTGEDFFTVRLQSPLPDDLVVEYAVTNIDPLIERAIGLLAASLPLAIAGDLIAGAGIASKSISLDSLSQQINTTASATNSGYGARVLQYSRELAKVMVSLRGKYRRMNFWAR